MPVHLNEHLRPQRNILCYVIRERIGVLRKHSLI